MSVNKPVSQIISLFEAARSPTALGLEKRHGFAMKIVKIVEKHWQTGAPTLPVASRWNIDA